MTYLSKLAGPGVAIAAMIWAAAAFAHSFSVALVFGGDDAANREILKGFLVAAAERDGHPDETADGHLGGLDVFVLTGDPTGADVVAVFAGGTAAGTGVVMPPATDIPALGDSTPGVARFAAAYLAAHGTPPTADAAEGYHAARRIDAAVRAQGGVGDAEGLRRSFAATSSGFTW